jgi:hypothetical protein
MKIRVMSCLVLGLFVAPHYTLPKQGHIIIFYTAP